MKKEKIKTEILTYFDGRALVDLVALATELYSCGIITIYWERWWYDDRTDKIVFSGSICEGVVFEHAVWNGIERSVKSSKFYGGYKCISTFVYINGMPEKLLERGRDIKHHPSKLISCYCLSLTNLTKQVHHEVKL